MPATPIRYLTEADVLALLPSIEVQIGLVEGALRAVATGTAHQPPKVPLNLGAGAPFAHAMPAAIDLGSGRVAGAKWISGGGAAGIGGVVLVERPKAGGLRGIVAAGELTAARTAAVSGAGLRIAPPSTAAATSGAPYKGAIIGGGLQAATHRAVLAALHPAITVAFYSRRAASELPLRPGDRVAESVNDAIRGADIIVTAAAFDTPPRPIDVKLIEPGATLLVIDYAATISGALVAALRTRGAVRVITDSAAQFDATRAAGKLGSALTGAWPAADAQIGELLGSAASTSLGIAFSVIPKSGRGASAVVSPVVIILQFFSGVFFVFTDLPAWMQQVAAIFPLKWMTQGMRSVFLPDSFAAAEVAGSWETEKTFLIILTWFIAGLIISIRTFKWDQQK
jgi:ornithine cyclodeaminase/alanine dehydrogenase-like protein (mu-crystallin family)